MSIPNEGSFARPGPDFRVFAETRDEMRVLLGPEKGYSPQPTQLDTAPMHRAHGAGRRSAAHCVPHHGGHSQQGAAHSHTHMHENDTHLSSMQQYNKKVKPPASIPPQSTKFD